MEPDSSVVADIDIRIIDNINELPGVGADKAHGARFVSSQILRLLVPLCAPMVCMATVIVVSLRPEKIVIGADGVTLDDAGRPLPGLQQCKIYRGADSCYFAISGVRSAKIISVATAACQQPGTIIDRAAWFEKAALPEIQLRFKEGKAKNAKPYANMRRIGTPREDVVFAGYPPQTGAIVVVQYEESRSGDMVPQKPMIRTGDPQGEQYSVAGISTYAREYEITHPEVRRLSGAELVRGLINGAIEVQQRHPELRVIGPPIVIVEITSTGGQFTEPGGCKSMARPRQTKWKK